MDKPSVRLFDRNEAGFYCVFGPIFGNRDVAKEVGINIYDDSDKKWFVSFDATEKLIGCASIRGKLISDCYVVQRSRRIGIFSSLLDAMLEQTSGTLRANCTPASLGAFNSRGFKSVRKSKNFTYVELVRA